jgi:hypothetical protein
VKALVWVDLGSKQIEVQIGAEDAVAAILEGSEARSPEQLVRMACNNFLTTMRDLPDEAITKQSESVRRIIAAELEALLARFRPTDLLK